MFSVVWPPFTLLLQLLFVVFCALSEVIGWSSVALKVTVGRSFKMVDTLSLITGNSSNVVTGTLSLVEGCSTSVVGKLLVVVG